MFEDGKKAVSEGEIDRNIDLGGYKPLKKAGGPPRTFEDMYV